MSEVNESSSWREGIGSSVVGDGEIRYSYSGVRGGYGGVPAAEVKGNDTENWKFHAVEFAKGFAEMSVEFGKGVRDVLKQSVIREDSVLVRKVGVPCYKVCRRLSFLNEYLPEDRDPAHAWSVIVFVVFLASAGTVI